MDNVKWGLTVYKEFIKLNNKKKMTQFKKLAIDLDTSSKESLANKHMKICSPSDH